MKCRPTNGLVSAKLTITTGNDPIWIAAQELVRPPDYAAWHQKVASTGLTDIAVLGESRNKRAISILSANATAKDVLLLVGRQHPAEVTGAFGFFAFYEALLSGTELAAQFRQRFNILAIPMLNPDGIVEGHWSHNGGGTDLNRDWGPFTQTETQLVQKLLNELDASGKRIRNAGKSLQL